MAIDNVDRGPLVVVFLDSWPTEPASEVTVILCCYVGECSSSADVTSSVSQMTGGRGKRRASVRDMPWEERSGRSEPKERSTREGQILSELVVLTGVVTQQGFRASFHCDLNPLKIVTGHGGSCPVPSALRAEDGKDVELSSKPARVT